MLNRLRRLRDNEQGMSLIYVTAGFISFFAATTLAIDVGMAVTARTQAQNSADAGALAGAIALALDDFDDRTPTGPAVQSSVNAALANTVMHSPVSVNPSDVTFPVAPSGEANRVRVWVYRTGQRANPLMTFISAIFNNNNVDISATATAEAAPANAMTCVKPFTIPDLWTENNIPPNDTFDRYDNHGDVIPNADTYTFGVNGYDPEDDKGTMLLIRAGTGNNIEPSFYDSWAMPGGGGANWYEENIAGCNSTLVGVGFDMTSEPGNMVGPTNHGVDALIAQDPTAYWDEDDERVVSPLGRSPRVFPIPLFDPDYYQSGKVSGRNATLKVANWVGIFLEYRTGNNVYGRIVPILGVIDGNAGPAPEGIFPRAVRLVE